MRTTLGLFKKVILFLKFISITLYHCEKIASQYYFVKVSNIYLPENVTWLSGYKLKIIGLESLMMSNEYSKLCNPTLNPHAILIPRGLTDIVPSNATHIEIKFKVKKAIPVEQLLYFYKLDFKVECGVRYEDTVVVKIYPTESLTLQHIYASFYIKKCKYVSSIKIQALGYCEKCDLIVRSKRISKRKWHVEHKLQSGLFKMVKM